MNNRCSQLHMTKILKYVSHWICIWPILVCELQFVYDLFMFVNCNGQVQYWIKNFGILGFLVFRPCLYISRTFCNWSVPRKIKADYHIISKGVAFYYPTFVLIADEYVPRQTSACPGNPCWFGGKAAGKSSRQPVQIRG